MTSSASRMLWALVGATLCCVALAGDYDHGNCRLCWWDRKTYKSITFQGNAALTSFTPPGGVWEGRSGITVLSTEEELGYQPGYRGWFNFKYKWATPLIFAGFNDHMYAESVDTHHDRNIPLLVTRTTPHKISLQTWLAQAAHRKTYGGAANDACPSFENFNTAGNAEKSPTTARSRLTTMQLRGAGSRPYNAAVNIALATNAPWATFIGFKPSQYVCKVKDSTIAVQSPGGIWGQGSNQSAPLSNVGTVAQDSTYHGYFMPEWEQMWISPFFYLPGGYAKLCYGAGLARGLTLGRGATCNSAEFPHKLWCAPNVHIASIAPFIVGGVHVLHGYTPQFVVAHDGLCNHGVFVNSGQCLCENGFGGVFCNQSFPTGFDPAVDIVCPDPNVYDLCGRRGTCIQKSTGVGVTCVCRPGFFGGTEKDDTDGIPSTDLYASIFLCTNNTNAPPSTFKVHKSRNWLKYPSYHQCALYDGDLLDERYVLDATNPSVPVMPYGCSNRTTPNKPFTLKLRGGLMCIPCPSCHTGHTVGCVDTNPVVQAQSYSRGLAYTPSVRCVCEVGWAGAVCSKRWCPISAADLLVPGGKECGAHAGRGTCNHLLGGRAIAIGPKKDLPPVPWSSDYVGRCVCAEGWGGSNGDCSVELCPRDPQHHHTACGPHGTCLSKECPNVTVTLHTALSAPESCIHLCNRLGGIVSGGGDCCDHAFSNAPSVSCNSGFFRVITHHCHGGLYVNPQQTYVDTSACAYGNCTCDHPKWQEGTNGLCNDRSCVHGPNGKECQGLLIRQGGHSRIGENVCNRDVADPTCECWLNQVGPPTTTHRADGFWGTTCQNTYTGSCVNPTQNSWCSNRGVCIPKGCDTDTLAGCTNRNGRPYCRCNTYFKTTGDTCQNSPCGGPSFMPCSARGQGVLRTGHCNTTSSKCECIVAGGQAYVGDRCETPASACALAGNLTVCSNHGECILNGQSRYQCSCSHGYNGVVCQHLQACGGNCDLVGGHCANDECTCRPFFINKLGGQYCARNRCVESGGLSLLPSGCNCSGAGDRAVPYPDSFSLLATDGKPVFPYRGCRSACPLSTLMPGSIECGGFVITGQREYSRCDGAPSQPSLMVVPTCTCGVVGGLYAPAINPFTHTNMNWITDGLGACKPHCMHCAESTDGLTCNTASCPQQGGKPCQYTGTFCDTKRCTAPGQHWDGTQCQCTPRWLHAVAEGQNCSTNVCVRSGGAAPLADAAGGCNCTYPLMRDTDPISPTYRHCIEACGVHGRYVDSATDCVCEAAYEGLYCNVTRCSANGRAQISGHGCTCMGSQWTGMLCDVSACGGGSPRVGVRAGGCDCYAGWTGHLCNTSACGTYGAPSGTTSLSYCLCDTGWSGTSCGFNHCGADLPIIPVPCGGTTGVTCLFPGAWTYNCNCGGVGDFDVSSGRCVLPASVGCSGECTVTPLTGCNGNGTLVGTANVLTCDCWAGHNGSTCLTGVCASTGLPPHARQEMVHVEMLAFHDLLLTGSVSGNDTDAAFTLATTTVSKCVCAPPYYDMSSDCTLVNCSLMAHPLEPQATTKATVVLYGNLNPTTCGCNRADFLSVVYSDVAHPLGVDGENETDPVTNVGKYINSMICVKACDRYHTVSRPDLETCVCEEFWIGDLCNTSNVTIAAVTIPLVVPNTSAPTPAPTSAPTKPLYGIPRWVYYGAGGLLVIGAIIGILFGVNAIVRSAHRKLHPAPTPRAEPNPVASDSASSKLLTHRTTAVST
ncbi:MAG: hypothetical protein JKY23_04245 [Nitrospinaceae bacterium]|nr:hypothetical protein [Nitrospinaceae bacterium]